MTTEKARDLKERTKVLAVDIVRLVQSLPRSRAAASLGDQLLRSGTSVAANYRAACRARSRREFVSKLGIVEEEADETMFWLDLLHEVGMVATDTVRRLRQEASELLAITISSIKTARGSRLPNSHSALRTPHSEAPIPHSAIRNSHLS